MLALIAALSVATAPDAPLPKPGPDLDQVVGSVLVCYAADNKAEALAGIRDERAAASYGGVVSLSRIHDLQREARDADKTREGALAFLRRAGRKTLLCSRPEIAHLVKCLHIEDEGDPNGHPFCSDDAWAEVRTLIRDNG